MKQEIIAQAAEAIILREGNKVIKRRVKKGYRLPELDEKLRKLRTRGEAKLLERAGKIIFTPKVLKADEKTKEIEMDFIAGKKLSEFLDNLKNKNEVMVQVGRETSKLHDNNIIHGDLTTSNMILVEGDKIINKISKSNKLINSDNQINNLRSDVKLIKDFKVFIIDFGLGFISPKIEDKAVDLHLIKQALEAKHFKYHEELFASFLKGYKISKDFDKVLKQLEKVELRGRNKH